MIVQPFEKPVYVTQPSMPQFDEFCEALKEIWNSRWLTNDGPVLRRYEKRLWDFFQTSNLCLFTNGTLALQTALQGMRLSGEVITTPFTFVATTHALYWAKLAPVFVDIEPDYYTIDPEQVEAAITPWTTAILAVHVYGHPCRLRELERIARKHNLALIYDAAHAFGVRIGDKPVSDFGDLSMFSFHATKLYHSIEGGMLVFRNARLKKMFNYLKNFGFKNETEVVMPGTNAKMNEFQALMGELMLRYVDEIIAKRRLYYHAYRELLADVPGIAMPPRLPAEVFYNYAYMPVEVHEEQFGASRDRLYKELKKYNVFTRRYFYPIVCDFACYRSMPLKHPLHVARRTASRILALPMFADLGLDRVERICSIIRSIRNNARGIRGIPAVAAASAIRGHGEA